MNYGQLREAAFRCCCLAFKRGDLPIFWKARKLHKKYIHLEEQAHARAARASSLASTPNQKDLSSRLVPSYKKNTGVL
jgi:hypothetical protein